LFRPYKNEVLDVRVVEVNEMGFYTTAGPCRIFVSRHAMPPDISGEGTGGYDDEEDAWISDDREVVIKRDSIVRLKILGEQVDLNEITAVGTIKEDYLGLISSEPLA
jgi:DNA-directed RNA polymerase II subunit RPB7